VTWLFKQPSSVAPRVSPHVRRRRSGASTPRGGFPAPLRASVPRADPRRLRSASQAPPTNERTEVNINKYICTGRLTKDPELRVCRTAPASASSVSRSTGWAATSRLATSTSASSATAARPPPGTSARAGWSPAWPGFRRLAVITIEQECDSVISVRLRGSRRRAASCCQPRPVPHAADPARRSPEAAATELLPLRSAGRRLLPGRGQARARRNRLERCRPAPSRHLTSQAP
jgi:hypothetical protein